MEWTIQGEKVIVRRGTFTSLDIHEALFATPQAPHTVEDMKEGIRTHLRRKHARGSCYDAEPPAEGWLSGRKRWS